MPCTISHLHRHGRPTRSTGTTVVRILCRRAIHLNIWIACSVICSECRHDVSRRSDITRVDVRDDLILGVVQPLCVVDPELRGIDRFKCAFNRSEWMASEISGVRWCRGIFSGYYSGYTSSRTSRTTKTGLRICPSLGRNWLGRHILR